MRDVAHVANVSVTTVSRVIRNDANVAPSTRDKVLQAVQKLNYYVNESARSIVKKRTKTVGLSIFDIANPFFPPLVRGVENTLNKFGYSLVLYNTDENLQKEEKFLKWMFERRVDRIILAPTGRPSSNIENAGKRNLAVVFVDREVKGIHADLVCVDNCQGAFTGVEHLIKLGHKRIGIIGHKPEVSTIEDRFKGYFQTLDNYGIDVDETLCVREALLKA